MYSFNQSYYPFKYHKKGEWTVRNVGGKYALYYTNDSDRFDSEHYLSNPQYILTINQYADIVFAIEVEKKCTHHINMVLFKCNPVLDSDYMKNKLIQASHYVNCIMNE